MNTTQRAIALLLKSAVTGQPETLPEDFCLQDARKLIEDHRIPVAIYEGAVRCGLDQSTTFMRWLLRISYEQSIRSEKQMQLVDRIFAAFEAHGIAYMPVKGCNTKQLYPKSALRPMGDADILIRTEDYPRIRPLMLELGLTEEPENDHVYPWRSDVMLIELHKSLVPQRHEDYYSYYGTGWRLAVPGEGCRHDLSPEDTYVFLFAHFARHYRSSGIGCRHVLDLYVYRRAYPELDEAYIRQELEKLGLLTFYFNMERTLAVWFSGAPEDATTELITQYIFSSGNWGSMEVWTLHQQAREAQRTGTARNSRRKALMTACFPSRDAMIARYPVLAKWPILLPVFWVVRIVQTLLFRQDFVKRRSQHFRAISDEKVEASIKAMEAVGLDFGTDT